MHTVLLIEDQADVAAMIQWMISRCGHTSLLAASLADARELWGKHCAQITMVLADNTLPDGSGIEFAKELASRAPGLPIVITSGMAYAGDPHDFTRLDKPFTVADFKAVVEKFDAPEGR